MKLQVQIIQISSFKFIDTVFVGLTANYLYLNNTFSQEFVKPSLVAIPNLKKNLTSDKANL